MTKSNTLSTNSDDVPLRLVNFIILLSLVVNFGFPHISLAAAIEQDKIKSIIYNEAIIKPAIQVVGTQSNEEIKLQETKKTWVKYSKYVTLTAYSSTVDQCDDTPFITANGTRVHNGTIAANFLKFGTRVRIPDYFGDKIFIVEDRTHPRYGDRVDIWMETRQQALNFGIRNLKIEVLK